MQPPNSPSLATTARHVARHPPYPSIHASPDLSTTRPLLIPSLPRPGAAGGEAADLGMEAPAGAGDVTDLLGNIHRKKDSAVTPSGTPVRIGMLSPHSAMPLIQARGRRNHAAATPQPRHGHAAHAATPSPRHRHAIAMPRTQPRRSHSTPALHWRLR